ncbi:helix-turn-helix domain-containing protein [Brevibacillus choshinensis]|uniref:helix-turn-helix domain-containing protein n=1 Tax=Brevibacillus choshinensis TaxID=54911 RepID=UPI002E1BCE5E|nr:helix-turn-helix domain-containing protein [Brevibacillus choshinensis]MED4754969.1 helix-turn-helix domain-containing protein [Brevibacillus choshinensis]MED4783649.1 helix-turn-helix domain-containing protein [Brevibacillus choshinensis]
MALILQVERAFLLALQETTVTVTHLPDECKKRGATTRRVDNAAPLLKNREREAIQQALSEAPSMRAGAQILGIARSTLYRKLREFGIEASDRNG